MRIVVAVGFFCVFLSGRRVGASSKKLVEDWDIFSDEDIYSVSDKGKHHLY
jgi:hypothetical protein